jgi:hypothetical protein
MDNTTSKLVDCTNFRPWEDRNGEPVRYREGLTAVMGGIAFRLNETQHRDGTVTQEFVVDADDVALSLDELREVAVHWLKMVDEDAPVS